LVEHDVERGRQELNFSEWGSYYATTRRRKLQWMDRALREETMPPWTYRILHPGTGLTQKDLMALEQWIEAEIANQPEKKSEYEENSK
jgi:Haem-binding domain